VKEGKFIGAKKANLFEAKKDTNHHAPSEGSSRALVVALWLGVGLNVPSFSIPGARPSTRIVEKQHENNSHSNHEEIQILAQLVQRSIQQQQQTCYSFLLRLLLLPLPVTPCHNSSPWRISKM
jgi:hypothetical protein